MDVGSKKNLFFNTTLRFRDMEANRNLMIVDVKELIENSKNVNRLIVLTILMCLHRTQPELYLILNKN